MAGVGRSDEGLPMFAEAGEIPRDSSMPRWTSKDLCEPLWMAPRAGFEVSRKFLS